MVAPFVSRLFVNEILPLWSFIILSTIASPSPVPFGINEK